MSGFIITTLSLLKLEVGERHSHWPALASGDGEEREERPENVVIVEVVLPPLSGLGRHVVLVIVQEMTPAKDSSSRSGQRRRRSDEEAGGGGGSVEGLPAVLLQTFGLVGAVEELALEELHGDDGEDEHEEDVDDEDVEDVLQRVDHAVEHGLGGFTHKHASGDVGCVVESLLVETL